jgi:hypothetical protein
MREFNGNESLNYFDKSGFSNLTIDELPDFSSINEFDEQSDIVAVISHPGWKSHMRKDEEIFKKICEYLDEFYGEKTSQKGKSFAYNVGWGILWHPEYYMSARQIFHEIELFDFLAVNNIPTIVTVPVKPYIKDKPSDDIKGYELLNGFSTEIFDNIMNKTFKKQRYKLGNVMSIDYPNYLRHIRGKRNNFYLLHTELDSFIDNDEAFGIINGDYNYNNLENESVFCFLKAIEGKKVFFAGSNLDQCLKETIGYSKFVKCDTTVLLNYCGISDKYEERIITSPPIFKSNIMKTIRENPQERKIIECLCSRFYDLEFMIDVAIENNVHYTPHTKSSLNCSKEYVTKNIFN